MTNSFVENTENPKAGVRGFASLDEGRRKEIARQGGKTAQALGRAHKFSAEEARIAGQKGGLARSRKFNLLRMQKLASAEQQQEELQ